MTVKRNAGKQKSASPDYPLLARRLVEASREDAASKPSARLAAGLYVVATPIGHRGDISLRALATLDGADAIACEDTRVSGALLSAYGIKKPLIPYHDHNADRMRPEIMRKIAAGEAVALISDAGMPLIADPGAKLVRECRAAEHGVTVIPGANAAITALAGSGLPTDRFTFIGFLPPKKTARRAALEKLRAIPITTVFYEAPQRLAATLRDMAEIYGNRDAAVARELTKLFEETRRGTLADLAAHYADHEPQGEITLVVAPPDDTAAPPPDLDTLLRAALRASTLRDAVDAVAAATGVKKSEVYARALAAKGEK